VWRPEEAHAHCIGRIVQPACTKRWSEEPARCDIALLLPDAKLCICAQS